MGRETRDTRHPLSSNCSSGSRKCQLATHACLATTIHTRPPQPLRHAGVMVMDLDASLCPGQSKYLPSRQPPIGQSLASWAGSAPLTHAFWLRLWFLPRSLPLQQPSLSGRPARRSPLLQVSSPTSGGPHSGLLGLCRCDLIPSRSDPVHAYRALYSLVRSRPNYRCSGRCQSLVVHLIDCAQESVNIGAGNCRTGTERRKLHPQVRNAFVSTAGMARSAVWQIDFVLSCLACLSMSYVNHGL
jgi:hypothetical protein